MEVKEKQALETKNFNTYLKDMFKMHHFLRLSVFLILLGLIIVLVSQGQCIIVRRYEINIIYEEDTVNQENLKYESITDEDNVEFTASKTISTVPGSLQCDNLPPSLRFDCHPEDGSSESSCKNRGCCWNPRDTGFDSVQDVPLNVPYCYYPRGWSLYKFENISKDGNDISGFLKQIGESFYKDDLPLVKVESSTVDDSILRIKLYDPLNKRYEPPWPIREDPRPFVRKNVDAKYKLDIDDAKPGFKVYRTSDNTIIFDSVEIGGFIFADQFLQISALLPTHNIYGIGEHQASLKLNTNWQIFTLFNKDQPPVENANLYGAHPFYLMMEDSGKSHGVLFLNSNAMDVILQPSPAITFRTIGGIFDIYFFLGPTPADVIKQYSEIVGKPIMPPYWSLGFHLCRYGYRTLEETKKVWNRTLAAGIPLDTQWNDLDYMNKNNDFTYSTETFKDLPEFVNELHSKGMHYIPLIDAGISGSETKGSYPPYDEGIKEDIFVKDGTTGGPFIGKVWNSVSTVWPDFTNPKTKDYYYRMMESLHKHFAYDGAWIDMNEPSNFYNGNKDGCSQNKLDYPKYVPKVVEGLLATKTLCMNAKHYLGDHYDLHNTYGTSHAIATNYALTKINPKKRPFIISRSTWVGHGHYASHWTGDVYSSWGDLKMSIPAILTMGFYQIPMVGADICGFNGNASVALCNRWMQLGAFYPFSRNHNSDDTIEQDPVAMGDLVVKSSRNALTTRYWFLPYLYTLFFRAHQFGETVARPLFFEYANDSSTYGVDTQFLWGNSLMIIPVLEEGKTKVTAYLPRGLWYNFYTREQVFALGMNYTLNAPLDIIPLMIRGGSILALQVPGNTTTSSRKNNFVLLSALDHTSKAKGELYWDDGESPDSFEAGQFIWSLFLIENDTLSSSKVKKGSFDEQITLYEIEIWGIADVSRVLLNGRDVKFEYDYVKSCLKVSDLGLDLREDFLLSWKYL